MNTRPSDSDAHRVNAAEHLRIRHLRLLELIERGGSLSYAARALHLSQPAVTKMLHELEAVFGPALVERGARGGRLTPRGHATLARLRLSLANFDAALDEREDPIPTLRVGLLPLVAVTMLPRALHRLWAKGMRLHLVLHEATVPGLLDGLLQGKIDCVIGRLDPDRLSQADSRQLRCTALVDESLAVAASPQHPLARARRATLRQLGEQRWALAHAGSNTRRQFDNAFIAAGLIPPRPDIESLSFHTNVHLVAGSDLLTLAPASAVADYERLGLVRRVRTDVEFPSGMLTFLALQSHPSLPALEALRAALLEDAGERAGLRRE